MDLFIHISWLVMGVALFGIHHYLSSRKQGWVGAIVPALYVIGVMAFFIKNDVMFFTRSNYPFVFLFIFLLADWIYGRATYKKKTKNG